MTGQPEGWGTGDLAVCVEYGPWFGDGADPVVGPHIEQVLWVAIVFPGVEFGRGVEVGLEFAEYPDNIFPASAFRRVKPDHSAADDAEFVALIQRVSVGASA